MHIMRAKGKKEASGVDGCLERMCDICPTSIVNQHIIIIP